MDRKTVFSLLQPSGELTIGNYIGAIKNFNELQNDYTCIFGVADLHSITIPQVQKDLRRRTYEVMAWLIASGIDTEKNILFVQSQIPEHAQLMWVLNSISYMGQLNRMTQYKEKSKKSEDNLNAALFAYPVLMAADILLYNSDYVPVGEDQRQHLELARELADRFNSKYSETFIKPEGLIPKELGKIYSLKDPLSKMSKSDPDINSYILLQDNRDTIIRKFKKAVTDSLASFSYNDEQPGLRNLINIYAAFSNCTVDDIVSKYSNVNYSIFKEDLGILVADQLEPMQNNFFELMKDKKLLEDQMRIGREKAGRIASKTLRKVYKKVGFVQV